MFQKNLDHYNRDNPVIIHSGVIIILLMTCLLLYQYMHVYAYVTDCLSSQYYCFCTQGYFRINVLVGSDQHFYKTIFEMKDTPSIQSLDYVTVNVTMPE